MNEADARAAYNGISQDYAKILYNRGAKIEEFGGGTWVNKCLEQA